MLQPHIKLVLGWLVNIPIPVDYSFLGTDIDFGKAGVIVESQFSNYPFLLNNTLRSELFFKAGTIFAGHPTQLVILITKALMYPASNSTLYYEQAVRQLTGFYLIFWRSIERLFILITFRYSLLNRFFLNF